MGPSIGDTICDGIAVEAELGPSFGSSAFGVVRQARVPDRGARQWLTVVERKFFPTHLDLSRFMAGANGLLSLQHPVLMDVGLVDRESDFCVVGVDALADARPLGEFIDNQAASSLLDRIAVEVARGLAFLHRSGRLHGALAPGTVLLRDGAPLLWQHGLVELCDPYRFAEHAGRIGGDVVAPEVRAGAGFDPRIDVYAWGALVAQIVAGRRGVEAVMSLLQGEFDDLEHPHLLGLAMAALDPDPDRRPDDGVNLLTRLQDGQSFEVFGDSGRARSASVRELARRYLHELSEPLPTGPGGWTPPRPGPAAEQAGANRSPGAAESGTRGIAPSSAEGAGARRITPAEPDPRRPASTRSPQRVPPRPAGRPVTPAAPPPRQATAGELHVSSVPEPDPFADLLSDPLSDPSRGPALGTAFPSPMSPAFAEADERGDDLALFPESSPEPPSGPPTVEALDEVGDPFGPVESPFGGAAAGETFPGDADDDDPLAALTSPGEDALVPPGRRATPEDPSFGAASSGERDFLDLAVGQAAGLDDDPLELVPLPSDSAGSLAPGQSGRGIRPAASQLPVAARAPLPEPRAGDPLALDLPRSAAPMPAARRPPSTSPFAPIAGSSAGSTAALPRPPGASPRRSPWRMVAVVLVVAIGLAAAALILAPSYGQPDVLAQLGLRRPSPPARTPAVVAGETEAPEDETGMRAPEPDGDEDAVASLPTTCPDEMVPLGRLDGRSVCMDKGEFPGLRQIPQVKVTLAEAEAACLERGRRLCSAEEWTRACRGPKSSNRFPYGTVHVQDRCNEASAAGVPQNLSRSGARDQCRTDEDIYDLAGNVAEWVQEGIAMGGDATEVTPSCASRSKPARGAAGRALGFRCCVTLAEG